MACWIVVVAVTACGARGARVPVAPAAEPEPAPVEAEPAPEPVLVEDKDLDSHDILARTEVAEVALVDHVLIGWRELADAYDGHIDPRAAQRSNAEAAALAQQLAARLAADPSSLALVMQEHSEDPSSFSGNPYEVKADSPFVAPFKQLALRLRDGEVGIVKTDFGYHVMMRASPPPPDPLESAAILARAPQTQAAKVKHILLGWTEAHAEDARGTVRTRAELEALVKATLTRLKRGTKFERIMAELSEDPGSAASGISYDVTPEAGLVEPFKRLGLRLKLREVGVVKTHFGMHILQRVK